MTNVYDPKVKYRTATGWLDPLSGTEVLVRWPTADTVGVYAIPGWTPTTTITDDNLRITTAGAVIEDVHIINGSILAFAPNMTIRRCLINNGGISNLDSPIINNGLVIEDCTIEQDPPGFQIPQHAVLNLCGMLVRRCAFINVHEGFQPGGSAQPLSDPTHPDTNTARYYDVYISGHAPGEGTEPCGEDFHGDLIQPVDIGGIGGVKIIIRNSVFWCNERNPYCNFSSVFDAYYGQCQPVDIDGMMMSGSLGPYRGGAGGSVKNMLIKQDSWNFYPVVTEPEAWPRHTYWDCCTFDDIDEDGQPMNLVARIPYTYPDYGDLAPVEPWEAPGLDTFGWEFPT